MSSFEESVTVAGIDAALAERLLEVGKVAVFASGESLFEQSTPRTWFGVVMAGRVELLEGRHGDPRVVATVEADAMVSEGFLLGESRPHNLTARAAEPTEVLLVDQAAIDRIRTTQPDVYAALILRVAQRLRQRLQSVDLATAGHGSTVTFTSSRVEHDALGERDIPNNAYYGIHTQRARENFTISGRPLKDFGTFVIALCEVKKAAAQANSELEVLDPKKADAIVEACDDIIGGNLRDEFIVDMMAGGAGMVANMCANEVIANRALEILGHERGEYQYLHPVDDVNMSQSANDVHPTALKLAVRMSVREVLLSLDRLTDALLRKQREFAHVLKMGRTENQDAIPMTLGQEFGAWEGMVRSARHALNAASDGLRGVNLGATAIGTGLNSPPHYAHVVTKKLERNTSYPLVQSMDLVEATQDMGAFIAMAGTMKRTAIALSKVCNDLRWLSSGPRAGLGELNLPAVQAGSSMMPGKVNPVIPEMVNQVCYQITGFDTAVSMAAESSELELTAAEPLIAYDLLQGMSLLKNATETLTTRCVVGITANVDVCANYVKNSIGLVTALVPALGIERAERVAAEALSSNRGVYELVVAKGWMTPEKVAEILDPQRMTSPYMAAALDLADTAEMEPNSDVNLP